MAKKETNLTLGISEPDKVDEYMDNLKHPLSQLAQYLRTFILSIDKNIGEGIYWNVPTFYFTGSMKPFDPKEYKRFIVNFNFYKPDSLRVIFLRGKEVTDPTGLLEGDFKDSRRITSFGSIEELKTKENELKSIIEQLIKLME